jgi:hypothetical protein
MDLVNAHLDWHSSCDNFMFDWTTRYIRRTRAVRGGHTPPERTMDMSNKRKSAAGGRTSRPPGSVFEIVDSTSDEQYWTLGMFPTLADALAALADCTPDDLPGDHDEYDGACRVEVREHKYGWGGTGKCVHAREWTSEYNEAEDEYEWRICTPNAGGEA